MNRLLTPIVSYKYSSCNVCVFLSKSFSKNMSKPKLLLTRNDFPSVGVNLLKDKFDIEYADKHLTKEKFCELVRGKFGIFCSPANINIIDKDILDAAGDSLKVISTFSVGYDHLDVKEIKSRGIRIGYTPNVLTEATAELAVAVLLATSRRILEANKEVLLGHWATDWSPTWLCGHGLNKSTVGVVGLGRIGLSVARKLKQFNISKLLYTSRKEKPEAKELGGVLVDIDTLVSQSDFIVLTVAFTPETKHIINRQRIAAMKSKAILVNVGRGGLVDQDALLEALQNKTIAGAGLDVMVPEPLPPDHPLLKLDNAVIVPHIGSDTYEAREGMSEIAAKNILAVLEGTDMVYEL